MKNKIVVLMSILAILVMVNQAHADTSILSYSNNIMTLLKKAITDAGTNIVNAAYKLLYIFATINTVLIGIKQLFKGANFQDFILEMIKFLMLIAFFTFILMQGPTVFINASQEFIGVAAGTSYTVEQFIRVMVVKMDVLEILPLCDHP